MKKIIWLFICTVFFLPQISNAENLNEKIYEKVNSTCINSSELGQFLKSTQIPTKEFCHCYAEYAVSSLDIAFFQELRKKRISLKSKEAQQKLFNIGMAAMQYCTEKLL
ncbi:Uncharacterised protein [Canicola haemoglobinophilus]|uniref:Uncharacterized protein n=1 Tax=Canicola haemoglobinophilus TaxID=733 RepID=A0AB38H971_9PAST|nr:hypothetical protein [Canicola haemoglobinophilus]STO55603.1 Uncharacterised protein [Canicola haemoglobinophilus]STO67929.1 Uncharacterised protein [Canicola haemoglobinophilus]